MIQLTVSTHSTGGSLEAVFWYRVLRQRVLPRTVRVAAWPTSARHVESRLQGLSVLSHWSYSEGDEAIVRAGRAYGLVALARHTLRVIAVGTGSSAAELIRALEARFERTQNLANDNEVWMGFWIKRGAGQASMYSRRIGVPTWNDVQGNYPTSVGESLDRLMHWRQPPEGSGQLLLFHGPPGTGKTWAIRALASEWRRWCRFECVMEPDRLFGPESDYLMDVLLEDPHRRMPFAELAEPDEDIDPDEDDIGPEENLARHRASTWRLLILEDTGDVLGTDARQQVGQALSRLLNVVDGLVGQGLQVLVLITTNEDLGKLHPAVIRPGRCLARVKFPEFDADAARAWLAARGITDRAGPARTLADLYAVTGGQELEGEGDRRIGFAPE